MPLRLGTKALLLHVGNSARIASFFRLGDGAAHFIFNGVHSFDSWVIFGMIQAYFIFKTANILEYVLLVRHQLARCDIRLTAIERAKMKGSGFS
jgi:hypothetical protein